MVSPSDSTWLKPGEVQQLCDVTSTTLRSWRILGKGPKYSQFEGANRYKRVDVEAWLASCEHPRDETP